MTFYFLCTMSHLGREVIFLEVETNWSLAIVEIPKKREPNDKD